MFLPSPLLTILSTFLFLFTNLREEVVGFCMKKEVVCQTTLDAERTSSSSVKCDLKCCFACRLPVEHYVVREESGHQHFYKSDWQPQHQQHN